MQKSYFNKERMNWLTGWLVDELVGKMTGKTAGTNKGILCRRNTGTKQHMNIIH